LNKYLPEASASSINVLFCNKLFKSNFVKILKKFEVMATLIPELSHIVSEIRANNIILNGFTMDKQKLLKLKKFIELINDLYENTPVDEEEEEENAEVNNENEYQEEENKE